MPNSKLKEKIREAVRAKLRERSQKKRKETEGHVNIEGVTKPKKRAPSSSKAPEGKKPAKPASVSVGAHGGQYIQEPSGHKKYVSPGGLAGRKKIAKSVEDMVKEIVLEDQAKEFVKQFRKKKVL